MNRFLLALVAISMVLPLTLGVTPQQFAQKYAKAGETSSTYNVSVNGVDYLIVSYSGSEGVVGKLLPGNAIELVSSESDLTPVVIKYLATVSPLLPQNKLALLTSHLQNANASWRQCYSDIDLPLYFFTGTRLMMYIKLRVPEYAVTGAAVRNLWVLAPILNDTLTNNPPVRLKKISDLLASSDSEGLSAEMASFETELRTVSTNFANYSTQYAIAYNAPRFIGWLPTLCTFNQSSVDSAITILSARSSIRKVSDVVSSIANQSANRVFLSLISDAVANWQTSIDAADSRVKAVQKTYSDHKIQLQGLNNQMRVLKESLAGLSNVSTQAELSASIRGLNESISLAMKKASDYGEIYPILKTALDSRDAAKAHILEASERVGPTDERISNMTVALKTLSNQVDVKIGAIQDGINVDKTELSNLASDLKALDADAAAIKPVEQEFDYTIAGGIMLLVIAIGGGIWFYLKSKPPKEIPIDQLPPL